MPDTTFTLTVTLPEKAFPTGVNHQEIAEAAQRALRDHFQSKNLLTAEDVSSLRADCCGGGNKGSAQ